MISLPALRINTPPLTLSLEQQIQYLAIEANRQFDELLRWARDLTGQSGQVPSFSADVDLQGHRIIHMADPDNLTDGANKRYVDEKHENQAIEIQEILDVLHDPLPPSSNGAIILRRAVPTTVADSVEIGSFKLINDAHAFDLAMTVSDSSFSVAKAYTIVTQRGMNTDWEIALPLFDTGPGSSQNFELDVKQTDAASTVSLRLRRTAGTTAGTATIQIQPRGNIADLFTESTATASVTPPTVILQSAILTVKDRLVGINTKTPLSLLHLSQDSASAVQLRLTDTVTPTDVTVRAAANLCDVDVLPASGSADAAIRLFRTTNTSGLVTLQIYLGTGSTTVNTQFAGTGNSYIAVNNGNLSIGSTAVGASAVKTVLMGTGTAPTSSPADAFQLYSADQAIGNACAHFRCENGAIILLFEGAALTAASGGALSTGGAAVLSTADSTILANAITRIGQLEARLQANGLIT